MLFFDPLAFYATTVFWLLCGLGLFISHQANSRRLMLAKDWQVTTGRKPQHNYVDVALRNGTYRWQVSAQSQVWDTSQVDGVISYKVAKKPILHHTIVRKWYWRLAISSTLVVVLYPWLTWLFWSLFEAIMFE
ncbi:hypothetical protein [Alteromonas macleodii]|uniref:DUF3592 domain-containing protein n=1 Tax=Alteromonas macleodii TaxID=28108 RepID=A0AB36FN56_ALTMA|nr:hypothetical protein [Alteromonas macleodii]OES23927.1 hypothetical protein BFV94_4975 [Alteromonas macleodii]OES24105.1 hypothetical protein BFV93_4858 [Alteromonas macleodii]OES25032.1 hypothetical protein BFV95_4500 [Alteromonas macleodii]OES38700.1 hypothetical protein BFV96_4811 [Alteromonas macleodii]